MNEQNITPPPFNGKAALLDTFSPVGDGPEWPLARKVLCVSRTDEGLWLRKSFVWRVVVLVAGGGGCRGWLGDAADDRALP